DHPLHEWIPHHNEWLAELLRHEGRCGFTEEKCPRCQGATAEIRCVDCDDLTLYCQECTVVMHKQNPYHRLKVWVQTHFRRKTLKDAGLRIQVGHPSSMRCRNPERAWGDDFVVMDISGIHSVGLDFCNCEMAQPHDIQLLRAQLFPATSDNPKTAATFRLLEHFHLLSTQANISGFRFYSMLERRTDNTGLDTPKDRYPELMRMMRQWRHLKMLKRFGRGHDPSGVSGTTPGSCAVECPACPHPGKNLPDNWKEAPPERRWLYRLFLGMDANFRLKRKNVSSDAADPGLNTGIAFFIEEKRYKAHIKMYGKVIKEETSTCNNHDAVKLANLKGSQGTAASGVGTVECSRHDMKRPCSVGDLQKGERYVNMDYLFWSSMQQNTPISIVVSYDIACQWSVHFWERMALYEHHFDRRTITFLIPKFHLPAHQESCHLRYSFNITPQVGRTDGEAVERGWAAVNPFASSTKEMGPGSRRDLLDDIFGAYNWNKITRIAESMLTKITNAIEEHSTHVAAFHELSAALPTEHVTEWTEAVTAWERDPSKPNPFQITQSTITQASVRLQLVEEDAAQLRDGEASAVHDTISPSMVIMSSLELEKLQCRLHEDTDELGSHSTDLQHAKVLERRNTLQRRYDAWSEVQQLYIPAVAILRSQNSDSTSNVVPHARLYLPSEILDRVRCDPFLVDCEYRLRQAQAHDALENLRRHLRLRSHLYHIKDRFVRGQRPNTRARGIIDTVQRKVDTDAKRYRKARRAVEVLSIVVGDQTWRRELRQLDDGDIRGMSEGLFTETEGRRTLRTFESLCRAVLIAAIALRVEWCKARARAHRWSEECQLLKEEMRRVVQYHNYQAEWWLGLIGRKPASSDENREGMAAYAFRQAELRTLMGKFCEKSWRRVSEWLKSGEVHTADDAEER
ncbi:uncharacterized protein LAESUDRAFT_657482, partial [Laetiporus sulphureus 93-53]